MSDTLLSLIAKPEEYNPYAPQQQLANVAQTQAATQGQNIQNQQGQLGLALTQARLAPFLSQATSGGQQGGLASFAAPASGVSTGSSLAGLATGSSAGGALPGDQAERIYGFAMPPSQALAIAGDKDPSGALAKAADERRQLLYTAAQGSPDASSWNQSLTDLARQGWIGSSTAQQLYGRFDLRDRVLASLTSPDAGASAANARLGMGLTLDANGAPALSPQAIVAKGAMAGAEAGGAAAGKLPYVQATAQAAAAGTGAGELQNAGALALARSGGTAAGSAPYETVTLELPNADGSTTKTIMSKAQYAQYQAKGGKAQPTIASGEMAPAALASIPSAGARSMAVNAALQAGLPAAAWPAWISAIHNESGWNLGQGDGAAGEIGPGQVKPATGQMVGYNAQQLRDPQTNLIASAKYFAQQWQAANGDPSGALRGYNGGSPSVTAAQPYADRAIQRAQGWAGSSAPSPATAPSPAVSNPNVVPAAASGTPPPLIHADERFPPQGSSTLPAPFNPAQIPPLGGAPDAVAPAFSAPQANAASPPAIPAAPPAAPGLTGTTMSTAAKAQTENDVAQMGDYRKGLLAQSQSAVQNNSIIDQMNDESSSFVMGKGANDLGTAKSWLDGLAKNFGVPESDSFSASLGSQQAFNKNAGQLARTAAKEVGSRTGAQELQIIQKTLPSDEMSSQGFQRVTTQLGGINDYLIAKSGAASAAQGNPNGFEANWNAHVSPTAFIINRMPADDLAALHANLMKTPQGQATWASLKTQVTYAQQNGLFGYVH